MESSLGQRRQMRKQLVELCFGLDRSGVVYLGEAARFSNLPSRRTSNGIVGEGRALSASVILRRAAKLGPGQALALLALEPFGTAAALRIGARTEPTF